MLHFSTRARRLLGLGILVALLAAPAWGQDEDDRLIAEDGDLRIYRSDDGQLKIKRAGDDDWTAVIDVDGDRTFVYSGPDDARHRAVYRWRGHDGDHPFVGFFDGEEEFDFDFEPFVDAARIGSDLTRSLAPFGDLSEQMEARREIARLDADARRLARRVRSAEGAERAELEAELDALLNDIFDKKLEARQDRIDRYAEEAEELRQETAERRQRSAEIIDRRKRDLLGEHDPLDW